MYKTEHFFQVDKYVRYNKIPNRFNCKVENESFVICKLKKLIGKNILAARFSAGPSSLARSIHMTTAAVRLRQALLLVSPTMLARDTSDLLWIPSATYSPSRPVDDFCYASNTRGCRRALICYRHNTDVSVFPSDGCNARRAREFLIVSEDSTSAYVSKLISKSSFHFKYF